MTCLVLMLFLGQSAEPNALVLVTRRATVTPKVAEAVARDLRKALVAADVPAPYSPEDASRRLLALGVKDATRCDGKQACVMELAHQLQLPALVSVSVTQLAKDVSIHVELWRVAGDEKLIDETVVVSLADLSTVATVLAPFAGKVHAALAPPKPEPKPEPKPDEPVAVAPPPPPPMPPPAMVEAAPQRSRIPALLLGALALGAGGAGVGLFAVASGEKSRADSKDQNNVSLLTLSQARALVDASNLKFTVALVCGITAAVLALVTAVLLGTGS